MVAFARQPGPKQPAPPCTPISVRTGPFTTTTCAAPDRVPVVEWQFAISLRWARTAASTTGMYSGAHPAITALIATSSAVTVASRVGTDPTTSDPSSPAIARNVPTRSGLGGTTGRPSVQPRRW